MSADSNIDVFFKTVAQRAWSLFKKDPLLHLFATVLVVVFGALSLGILAGPLLLGYFIIVAKRMRDEPATPWDVFDGLRSFLAAFLAFVLIGIGIALGAMLFVLPGLLVALLTMYVFAAMGMRQAKLGEAFSSSYELVKSNPVVSILLLLVLAIANAMGGSILVGVLLTLPLTVLAIAVAFDELLPRPPMVRPEPVVVPSNGLGDTALQDPASDKGRRPPDGRPEVPPPH